MMKRILIVDDVLELGHFLQAALATLEKNLDIRVLATAEEALLEATRKPVDLLVTEVRLPGISGIDLARRIQQSYPGGKVIFISTLTNKKIDQQIADLNAAAYFHKPLQIPRFLEAAARALGIIPAWEREEEQTQGSEERLSNRLSALRHSLQAKGVYLLGENGTVIAQTGENAETILPAFTAPLMAAVSGNNRLARLSGSPTPGFACSIQGWTHDLVFSAAGDFTLLLIFDPEEMGARLAVAHQELLKAGKEIAAVLRDLGAQSSMAEEKTALAVESQNGTPDGQDVSPGGSEEDEFASKLMQEAKKVTRQTADEFWKEQVESGKVEPLNPDVISYEQAVKLGIAPPESDNVLPAEEG